MFLYSLLDYPSTPTDIVLYRVLYQVITTSFKTNAKGYKRIQNFKLIAGMELIFCYLDNSGHNNVLAAAEIS